MARRSTPTLVEAAHKTKSKPRATTINMTEKLYKKLEGEGGKGDLPGYVPTEGYRWIQVMYKDWAKSNNGEHLNGGIDKKMYDTRGGRHWHSLLRGATMRQSVNFGVYLCVRWPRNSQESGSSIRMLRDSSYSRW